MPTNEDRPHLPALIRARQDRGESLRSMADRARRAGHNISHAHIGDLLLGRVARAPLPQDIVAIAAALDASYDVVRRAVLHDWYDYDELRGGDFDALISPLPDADRDELERMVRAWVAAKHDDD